MHTCCVGCTKRQLARAVNGDARRLWMKEGSRARALCPRPSSSLGSTAYLRDSPHFCENPSVWIHDGNQKQLPVSSQEWRSSGSPHLEILWNPQEGKTGALGSPLQWFGVRWKSRILGPVQTFRLCVSGDSAQQSAGESHQAAGERTEV